MKIVFVADISSPIASNWVRYFVDSGDQVEVISQFPPVAGQLPAVRVHYTPLLMSWIYAYSATGMARKKNEQRAQRSSKQLVSAILRNLNSRLGLQQLWYGYGGPIDAMRLSSYVQKLIDDIKPDIVHGMRIPMEGETIRRLKGYPVILSIWGNDLTLWAEKYDGHRRLTVEALQRADALHADCRRDIALARKFGYSETKPTLVSPSGAGIHLGDSLDQSLVMQWRQQLGLSQDVEVVVNPRGVRDYIRTEEYLRAIPKILQLRPNTVFVSIGVAGNPHVMRLVNELGIGHAIRLLPTITQTDLAAIFHLSSLTVSPSIHDGTPNTLLEGMAYGAFPLAGNIESVREWITHGENGLLFDATDPDSVAAAVVMALNSADLRESARTINRALIAERADHDVCMQRAREFYRQIIAAWEGH